MAWTRAKQLNAQRRHYERNKAKYIAGARAKQQLLKQYVRDAKTGPCADCGVAYPPVVMDFDHRPGTVKTFDVAQLFKYGSLSKVQNEIAKCDLVCANCHRLRTWNRLQVPERCLDKKEGDRLAA